jgi:O-acetyl-ADP-ribose deacetylase (regulator of RNase III)
VSDRPTVQIIADLATDPPEWWPMSKSEAHTVVAALLDAYRERDEAKGSARAVADSCARTVRDFARSLDEADEQLAETVALHNGAQARAAEAERQAAQLRETLGWVEQWADSGNDNHLSLLLTVRAALAASRGDQSSRS